MAQKYKLDYFCQAKYSTIFKTCYKLLFFNNKDFNSRSKSNYNNF